MKNVVSLLVMLTLAAPLAAQDVKYGERLEVNVVVIDAVVTDAQGNQILGLDRSDFIVTENGVPQTVESLDYFTNRRLLDMREEKAFFKVDRVSDERLFILFFDKPASGQLIDRLQLARRGAREFIDEQMRDADRAAIVGHDVRLKVYSDFTSDKQQLKRALDEVIRFGPGQKFASSSTGSSILREADLNRMMNHTGTVYEAIRLLSDGLRRFKGRKNLVLFSPGIREPGEDVRDGILLNESRYYAPMIQSLNAANISVYSVNLLPNAAEVPVLHQTLQRIASDTNGEYFRHVVSYASPLEKIEEMNNGYYLLTYSTKKPKGTRGYQKVEVRLKNREFRIKARDGYAYGE